MEWEGKLFKTPGIFDVRVKARTDAILRDPRPSIPEYFDLVGLILPEVIEELWHPSREWVGHPGRESLIGARGRFPRMPWNPHRLPKAPRRSGADAPEMGGIKPPSTSPSLLFAQPKDYSQNVNGAHQNRRRPRLPPPLPDMGQGSPPSRVACDETLTRLGLLRENMMEDCTPRPGP